MEIIKDNSMCDSCGEPLDKSWMVLKVAAGDPIVVHTVCAVALISWEKASAEGRLCPKDHPAPDGVLNENGRCWTCQPYVVVPKYLQFWSDDPYYETYGRPSRSYLKPGRGGKHGEYRNSA